jgi:hypothetical protein
MPAAGMRGGGFDFQALTGKGRPEKQLTDARARKHLEPTIRLLMRHYSSGFYDFHHSLCHKTNVGRGYCDPNRIVAIRMSGGP